MNSELSNVLDAVRERAGDDCSAYTDLLTGAANAVDPLFFRREYREFFLNCGLTVPGWMPRVLMGCSASESRGSRNLFEIWKAVDYYQEAELGILEHSRDEARHARMFLRVLREVYPQAYTRDVVGRCQESLYTVRTVELAKALEKLPEEYLRDYMLQINFTEIRTRIHLRILAPVYFNSSRAGAQDEIAELAYRFEEDELSHISYTAKLIDKWARENDLRSLAKERLHAYNLHTIEHTKRASENFCKGRMPGGLDQ